MAKKERTRDTAADYARRSNAISRMGRRPRVDVPGGAAAVPATSKLAPTSTRDMRVPRPDDKLGYLEERMDAMTPSMRPRMRPDDKLGYLEERMDERRLRDLNEMYNRQDEGPSRRQMEQGFKEGGMVTGTGSRAQISGTKFSGTF